MRPERSFQGLILTLQRYWADYGCVILQPYDMEVGAGTFHPATTLRALGPKRWNAAYVQPSRRPKDGRYGEKVLTPVIAPATGLLSSFFGRKSAGSGALGQLDGIAGLPDELISALETRAIWAKFGF